MGNRHDIFPARTIGAGRHPTGVQRLPNNLIYDSEADAKELAQERVVETRKWIVSKQQRVR